MKTCGDCAYFVKEFGFCSNYDFETTATAEACDTIDPANMCCANCARCYMGKKYDYSHGGCKHSDMEGYICMAGADEKLAIWMVGNNMVTGKCEAYTPREAQGS